MKKVLRLQPRDDKLEQRTPDNILDQINRLFIIEYWPQRRPEPITTLLLMNYDRQ